jgi:hypothetical protein
MSCSTIASHNPAAVTALSVLGQCHANSAKLAQRRGTFSACWTRRDLGLQGLAHLTLVSELPKRSTWIQAAIMDQTNSEGQSGKQVRPLVLDSHLHVWASEEEVSRKLRRFFVLLATRRPAHARETLLCSTCACCSIRCTSSSLRPIFWTAICMGEGSKCTLSLC